VKKIKLLLVILVGLAFVIMARYLFYRYLQQKDKVDRPWSYADKDGYAFTGLWQGIVIDADGEKHHLSLTLISPYDDEYRKKRASNKRIKRDRSSKNYFEGDAVEMYKGKSIKHRITGNFISQKDRTFKINFITEDNERYEGFNLNLGSGFWQDDHLAIDVSFAYFNKELFSEYNSADARHDFIGKLNAIRKR
jgi:hypothetical protein